MGYDSGVLFLVFYWWIKLEQKFPPEIMIPMMMPYRTQLLKFKMKKNTFINQYFFDNKHYFHGSKVVTWTWDLWIWLLLGFICTTILMETYFVTLISNDLMYTYLSNRIAFFRYFVVIETKRWILTFSPNQMIQIL